MTLDDIIKHQSIIDKREPSSDTLQFLELTRYSKSKDCLIRYGSMHIDHFIRVFNSENNEKVLQSIFSLLQRKEENYVE
jgi:hypothetical protein|tara:strand:+ start:2121 stop:2357 length:237 start_codon:yes stop_codon:yes gene_type:complete